MFLLNEIEQDAQLSQTDRAAGCVSLGQKWNTRTGRQYFTDIIGLSSTTVTYLACKAIEFGEKRKIRAITPFKVIEVSTAELQVVLARHGRTRSATGHHWH